MGHREKWKLHNGCTGNEKMLVPQPIKVEAAPVPEQPQTTTEKDCVVPDWAKNMGHEDKWKLHNGCK